MNRTCSNSVLLHLSLSTVCSLCEITPITIEAEISGNVGVTEGSYHCYGNFEGTNNQLHERFVAGMGP